MVDVLETKYMIQIIHKIIISIIAVLIFACNPHSEKNSTIIKFDNDKNVISKNRTTERFFPETKNIETFDTIIEERQIQITIAKTDLDSYLTNEYDDDDHIQIDKYRDAEISLTIKQNSQVLLDTIFRKDMFSKYATNGFMDIAIFQNYWLDKIDNNKIEFFGIICKPETDNSLPFYHYFDLNNKQLNFIIVNEDE